MEQNVFLWKRATTLKKTPIIKNQAQEDTDNQYKTQTQRWGSVAANLQRCSCALSLSKGLKRTWLTLPLFFVCANTCTGIHLESLLRMFYSAMKTRTGESRLNASDHLCQCHHCICHHGMKLPRQGVGPWWWKRWGVATSCDGYNELKDSEWVPE